MKIITLCETLLLMSRERPQLHLRDDMVSFVGQGLTDQSMDLVKELGVPKEEIKKAFQILVAADYFGWKNPGQNDWIEVTSVGVFLRENGGYRHHIERNEDRDLQRLVAQSVIDTNRSVLATNVHLKEFGERQTRLIFFALLVSAVSASFSILSYFKEDPKEYRVKILPESEVQAAQNMLTTSICEYALHKKKD